jgi:Zn-dependent protease
MISIPGRIPIHISPFFWFLILLIGWLNSGTLLGTAIWSAVILVSVVIHEYGHALTALLFGQTAEISLVGLGGLTKRQGPKLDRWKEFFIVLNGPLAGFAVYFLAYFFLESLSNPKPVLYYALNVAVNVNLFWTLLNLLPVMPLDGGHLLRIILEGIFGVSGLKAALVISILLGGLIGVYFFIDQQLFIGALFFLLAFESYRSWEEAKNISPEDSDQDLQNMVKEGMEAFRTGRQKEALEKFSSVRGQAPKGVLYVAATQYGARVLAEQGQFKQAYDWLLPLKNRLSNDYLHLLQQLAFRVEEWEDALAVGELTYTQDPTVDTALMNALSCGIMGKAVPAVGWLRCAIQQGLPDIRNVVERREFDAVRETDPFQKWLKSTPPVTNKNST